MLAAFDVVAMSSRTEGTPIILFEAIQAGIPVVTTAVGGIPDVVSSAEACLVPPVAPRELAVGILRTLDDSTAAADRSARAQARIKADFSPSRWVERYSAVYEAALSLRA
jgi:glycosyltransferase involved in cell wall biosynthesis